jgi:hypothetical protein
MEEICSTYVRVASHPGAWLASRPVTGRPCGSPVIPLRTGWPGVRVRQAQGSGYYGPDAWAGEDPFGDRVQAACNGRAYSAKACTARQASQAMLQTPAARSQGRGESADEAHPLETVPRPTGAFPISRDPSGHHGRGDEKPCTCAAAKGNAQECRHSCASRSTHRNRSRLVI